MQTSASGVQIATPHPSITSLVITSKPIPQLTRALSKGINWQVENTLTYDKTIGKHSFAVVLGQSAMKNKSDYLNGSCWNLVNVNKPSIDYATGKL